MVDAIRLKRAYADAAADDGARILVDRLWPRGLSKSRLQLDAWLKEVAPSTELRQWFDHRAERWETFRQRYYQELDGRGEALAELRDWLRSGPVTLLYAARDPEYNHARVLRDYLQETKED